MAAAARAATRAITVTDRLTVVLLAVATFLVLLGVLAHELGPSGTAVAGRPVTVLRRVYETRVITTIPAGASAPAGGSSVTQSVSGSAAPVGAAPTTRTS